VAAGNAMARADVQWSVTIGTPAYPVYGPPPVYVHPAPVYMHPVRPAYPVYAPPIYVTPAPRYVYRQPHWDRDRDGIPDRYDPVYNPPWDRDGDGIPNRHDRWDNRRGHWGR
jgi:hypothetical protein